jgi:hypothetical protein
MACRGGVTIGADWDPTPTQISLFATRNFCRLLKGAASSAPIDKPDIDQLLLERVVGLAIYNCVRQFDLAPKTAAQVIN